MSFRYQRRIHLGQGVGLNLSKSGVSSSIRTRWGSFGSKGFSLRTGIPGLTYRKQRGSKKGDGSWLIVLVLIAFALVAWNLLRFLFWLISWLWARFSLWLEKRRAAQKATDEAEVYVGLDVAALALPDKNSPLEVGHWLVTDGALVHMGQAIVLLWQNGKAYALEAEENGRIQALAFTGQKVAHQDLLYKIKVS